MTSLIQKELADDRTTVFPMTVGKYHAMIKQGIVPEGEPFELLGGLVVGKDRSAAGEDPVSVGLGLAFVVKRLAIVAEAGNVGLPHADAATNHSSAV